MYGEKIFETRNKADGANYPVGLCDWVSSLNQSNQNHYDGDHQKYVDEAAKRVGSNKPERPEYEEQHRDGN